MTRVAFWPSICWCCAVANGCVVESMSVASGQGGSAHGGNGSSPSQGGAGATNTGGALYTACTGKFEEIRADAKSLCVAKMARISGPSPTSTGGASTHLATSSDAIVAAGSGANSTAGATAFSNAGAGSVPASGTEMGPHYYSIDVTEVTRGQYEAWVATNPELPASDDPFCAWKRDDPKKFAADLGCKNTTNMLACKTNCQHHPQVCVDWCDAFAYCAAVNKRLCGRIGGGPNPYDDYDVADQSQWYRACSAGGTIRYPYGDRFDSNICRGGDFPASTSTVEVGTLDQCVTATGVYDLSGNVREWEDSCDVDGGCRMRGGSFGGASDQLRCSYAVADNRIYGLIGSNRAFVATYVGFRCCSR